MEYNGYNQYNDQYNNQYNNPNNGINPNNLGKYSPLSPWAYFGYTLLFSIPIAGFIMLIVFSFDETNINRRNYARSYWCTLLFVVALVVIISVIGASFFSGYRMY